MEYVFIRARERLAIIARSGSWDNRYPVASQFDFRYCVAQHALQDKLIGERPGIILTAVSRCLPSQQFHFSIINSNAHYCWWRHDDDGAPTCRIRYRMVFESRHRASSRSSNCAARHLRNTGIEFLHSRWPGHLRLSRVFS